jgi:hypothetical protein
VALCPRISREQHPKTTASDPQNILPFKEFYQASLSLKYALSMTTI